MDQSTPSSPTQSPLLSLPAELREHIIEFALTSDKPLVAFRLDNYQQDTYQEATQPPLTTLSRQLRHETLPPFYRLNTFILHTDGSKLDDTRAWLRCTESHIPKLHRLDLWVRYMTVVGTRSLASGAISLGLWRGMKEGEGWKVDRTCKWVTVTRLPYRWDSDGRLLMGILGRMLDRGRYHLRDAEGVRDVLVDLRMGYAKEKVV